jgi:hypothetical protein
MEETMHRTPRSPWIYALLSVAVLAAGCSKKEQAGGEPAAAPASSTASEGAPAAAAPGPGGLVSEDAQLDGRTVKVDHSKFDIGQPQNLFDNDPKTLARTEKANPAIIEITFDPPKVIKSVSVTTGSMDIGLTARVTPDSGAEKVVNKEYRDLPADPTVDLEIDKAGVKAKKIAFEIKNLNGGDGHIHIRDIKFK